MSLTFLSPPPPSSPHFRSPSSLFHHAFLFDGALYVCVPLLLHLRLGAFLSLFTSLPTCHVRAPSSPRVKVYNSFVFVVLACLRKVAPPIRLVLHCKCTALSRPQPSAFSSFPPYSIQKSYYISITSINQTRIGIVQTFICT